jgi:hypothetical protein
VQLSIPYVITGPDGTRAVVGNSDAAKADVDWVGHLDPENGISISREVRESVDVASDQEGAYHGRFLRGRASIVMQGVLDPNAGITTLNAFEAKLRRACRAFSADAQVQFAPDGYPARAFWARAAQDPAFAGRRPKTFQLQLISARPYALAPTESQIVIPVGARGSHFPNPSAEAAKTFVDGPHWAVTRIASSAAIPAKYGSWINRHAWDGVADANMGRADVTFASAGTWVVSLWVWVPSSYTGGPMGLRSDGSYVGSSGEVRVDADLTKRDQWQRVQTQINVVAGDLVGFWVLRYTGPPAAAGTGIVYTDAIQDDLGAVTPFSDGNPPGVISPVASPFSAPFNEVGAAYVTGGGELPTWPRFRILGPITNPQLYNERTGEIVRFAYQLGAGEFLDVYSDPLSPVAILLGGTTDRYRALDRTSRWWQLQTGENAIRVSATAYSAGAQVTMFTRDGWD